MHHQYHKLINHATIIINLIDIVVDVREAYICIQSQVLQKYEISALILQQHSYLSSMTC